MLNTLQRYRTAIGTVIVGIAGALVFFRLEFIWYYALPYALVAGLLGAIAWSIFLELLARSKY